MHAKPHPALVSREAATRLPRLALLAMCAAYVLPGLFGRDPWRGADLGAFGKMLAMAEGRSPWLSPILGGVPADGALLPHWLGAAVIWLTSPWLDPALAARVPFALLLVLTLVAVWYASYHLACSDAAQPVPFAFGGEADRTDYARAVADGALLALLATLGLLQLGHETTPELAQLAAIACFQWALSAAPNRPMVARVGVLLTLPALAASGAPSMALALGIGAILLEVRDRHPSRRGAASDTGFAPLGLPPPPDRSGLRMAPWLAGATLLALAAAWSTQSWAWRVVPRIEIQQLGKLWLWFLWPSWLLAGWTVWRWRMHLGERHLVAPLLGVAVALASCIAMGGSDRALMLGLPGMATLAAFALPTLGRSTSAAIDWFSVCFFSVCAMAIWVIYASLQTGIPAKPAANVARLAPGFEARLSWIELGIAAIGTAAWLWLVRWRTARHRAVIWKSLVLPASGVVLCWLLLMTLWLPLLDYARSYRPLIERLARTLPANGCIAAPEASASLVAALEFHARHRVDARPSSINGRCEVMVLVRRGPVPPAAPPGWVQVAAERRPTERFEFTLVYRRRDAPRQPPAP